MTDSEIPEFWKHVKLEAGGVRQLRMGQDG